MKLCFHLTLVRLKFDKFMTARASTSLLLAVIFLFASSAFGKDVWTQVRSKNFLLVGNANEKEVRAVGFKLEQFRQAFRQILPSANFDSATPTTVIVFKDDQSYKPFKPVRTSGEIAENVKGYFLAGDDVNYIALALNVDEKATYSTIFHEYVHFVVNNNFGRDRVPPWFNEGLAAYYQTFWLENDRSAVVGEPPAAHLRFLRREAQLIPLETLFNTDYYQLRNQGAHGASAFYSQAWLLMHFLQHAYNGARRAELSRFLELLLAGKHARTAFETAFQTDYVWLENALTKYVAQNEFSTAKYVFKGKLAPDFECAARRSAKPPRRFIWAIYYSTTTVWTKPRICLNKPSRLIQIRRLRTPRSA